MSVNLLFQRLASLSFTIPILNLLSVFCFLFVGYVFIFSTIEMQNQFAIPCLLFGTWGMLLNAVIRLSLNAPRADNEAKGLFSRIKKTIQQSLFTIALIIFIFMSLALCYLTLRILGT